MQAPGPWDFHYREVWCVPRNGVGQTRQLGFTHHTQHHRIFFQPKEGRAQARLSKLGAPGAVLSYTSAVGPGGLRLSLEEREVPHRVTAQLEGGPRTETPVWVQVVPPGHATSQSPPPFYLQIPRNLGSSRPQGAEAERPRDPAKAPRLVMG